jgi:hypothetical protein
MVRWAKINNFKKNKSLFFGDDFNEIIITPCSLPQQDQSLFHRSPTKICGKVYSERKTWHFITLKPE